MSELVKIESHLHESLRALNRKSVVVGVSGGIDSSVTLSIAARALGAENVTAIAMPERESAPASLAIARELCDHLGVRLIVDDVTSTLETLGVYAKRDAAISRRFPTFVPGTDSFSMRIVQNIRGANFPAWYEGLIAKPGGETVRSRIRLPEYQSIFAASNMKQRVRTMKLYEFAEERGAAVLGTSNWDETYLGFFVKLGDGSWDVCLLNQSTKMDVWALAAELALPQSVVARTSTTDTFPDGGGSQTDMFYALPFEELDLILDLLRGRLGYAECLAQLNWPRGDLDRALENLQRRHRSTEWNRSLGLGRNAS